MDGGEERSNLPPTRIAFDPCCDSPQPLLRFGGRGLGEGALSYCGKPLVPIIRIGGSPSTGGKEEQYAYSVTQVTWCAHGPSRESKAEAKSWPPAGLVVSSATYNGGRSALLPAQAG